MFSGETDSLFDLFGTPQKETTTSIPSSKIATSIPSTVLLKRTSPSPHEAKSFNSNDSPNSAIQTAKKLKKSSNLNSIVVADSFSEELSTQVPAVADPASSSMQNVNKAPTSQQSTEMPSSQTLGHLILSHQVRHQVAVSPDYPYVPIGQHVSPEEPARTYPFTLDPFQKVSISCIERNESVLVSAHTSAGKTVVAEYAIAQSLKNKQRVIYTSPIKALSNQKYRELLQEFGDVGLMTGDVTINPSASCLVMTTEILRSMLYRGSEVMREVAWVIFDEIHYMRDKERGVVWEETIILLPDKVHYVFLSATIPNAMEFAEWICQIHSQPCHVVYTDYRPTPLQHYLFPAGGEGIHLVVDEKGAFRQDSFEKAISNLSEKDPNDSRRGGRGKGGKGPSDIYKIVKMIFHKNYHPVIVFSFSKRECEALALQMSKLDFNSDAEKELVATVFDNAMMSLSEDDRTLPQIEHILPLLRRGVGIHHSGLLPILKEVIEILFQEGLLKVLFATETFSIGLNMPAKTVVFTSVRKFDGRDIRWVSGGEYIQMSGRAGRRGLDDRGIVILMVDEKMEPEVAKSMVKGTADPLNSAFHLKYNMILNLLRVEGMNPEYMLEQCFYQFQNTNSIPGLEDQLRELEEQRDALAIDNQDQIAEYYDIRQQLDIFADDIHAVISHPSYCLPFLQPGRLVTVKHKGMDFGWGAVVSFQKVTTKESTKGKQENLSPISETEGTPKYIVNVLLNCRKTNKKDSGYFEPVGKDDNGVVQVVGVMVNALYEFSTIRIFLPKDLKPPDARQTVGASLKEVQKRFGKAIPLLDPIADMGIKDEAFKKLIKKVEILEEKLKKNPLNNSPNLPTLYEVYAQKVELTMKHKTLKRSISQANSIMQMDELKARKRVLRRLGFTSPSDVVELKGRVACEISTGDELLLTEMMFNGVFNDLTVEQCVSLLSCFVFQEKVDEQSKPKEELAAPLRIMQESARRIARVCQESKLGLDEEEYVQSFRPELMDVTFAWCQGATFAQLCKMTTVFEGSIIRAMRRLEELLRQMCAASKSIGNIELENKFAQGITKIKRDIIFANSLYL